MTASPQTYFVGRPLVPEYLPNEQQHRRAIAQAVNLAMQGQSNNSMQVTLAASATSTTVIDSRISLQTACHLVPMTAAAATEAAGGALYVVPTAGECVIHHSSSVSTTRTFAMSLIG